MRAPRAWQRMLSGRRLDLLDPAPLDIEIDDIAHGLSFVARWNGQTRGEHPYSVAEHSLLVETIVGRIDPAAPAALRLAALLHDASEYVLGDMISPVKSAIGAGYVALDARLTAAVHLRFGLPAVLPPAVRDRIKRADRASAWLEAVTIAGFTEAEATRLFRRPPRAWIEGLAVVPNPARIVRAAFLARHAELVAACDRDRGRPPG
jgi:5'-deoxynucleotidase YfbR-like HD superfamily hydrolase